MYSSLWSAFQPEVQFNLLSILRSKNLRNLLSCLLPPVAESLRHGRGEPAKL
uniref:Uncharacterized protein n=1 Tax=Arundo donax TaxID=35708 RepID=A0A0A8ZSQ8_ARUDO